MSGCCFEADGGVSPGSGGGGGSAFLTKIDTSALSGVQMDLQFEDDLTDSSANGLDLTVTAENPQFMTHKSSLRICWAQGLRRWQRPANDPELTITGEMTIHFLGILSNVNTGKLFTMAGPTDAEADNWLFSLQNVSGGGSQPLIRGFTEHGGGVNDQYDWDVLIPEEIGLLTYLRRNGAASDSDVLLFWNGEQISITQSSIPFPTGGTTAHFELNDTGTANNGWASWFAQFVVQNVAMSEADILAVAQQVGVAPA